MVHAVLGGQAHQAARVLHFVHHGVAGVDTQAAANAVVLHAVADVDTHGADLHTQAAVDAVPQALGLVVGAAGAGRAGFTTATVVGHHQGVLVDHHALEAGIGAHVGTHLFAQEARVAVGGQGVEADPEQLPAALQRQQLGRQGADGHEVADEGEAGPACHQQPQQVAGATFADLLKGPGGGVEPQAGAAVTFHLVFDPHKQLGVHRLGAGEATPQPPGDGGEEEQRQRADHQQAGEVNEVLRVQHQPEQVEAARTQVEQHHLAFAPLDPRQAVKHQLGEDEHGPAPAGKHAADGAGLHLLLRHVERIGLGAGWLDGDDFARRPGGGGASGRGGLGRHRGLVMGAHLHVANQKSAAHVVAHTCHYGPDGPPIQAAVAVQFTISVGVLSHKTQD